MDLNARLDRLAKRIREGSSQASLHSSQEDMQGAVADPLAWMQRFTHTKDHHWREAGAKGAYRPFPDKPYFSWVLDEIRTNSILFIEKSRDLMLSWLCVGFFTHTAMTTPGCEVLFQSQKEEKAGDLIEYARILYGQQDQHLKRAFPLTKPLAKQSGLKLEFANGSRLVGIPEGADQIRSYHPWGLLIDEAAFQPKAGESYNHSISVCQKIVVLSSAGPGWFADFVTENL